LKEQTFLHMSVLKEWLRKKYPDKELKRNKRHKCPVLRDFAHILKT